MVAFAVDDTGSIALLVTQRPSIGNIESNIVFMNTHMEGCLLQRRGHGRGLPGLPVQRQKGPHVVDVLNRRRRPNTIGFHMRTGDEEVNLQCGFVTFLLNMPNECMFPRTLRARNAWKKKPKGVG
jgi:hypothetical protein